LTIILFRKRDRDDPSEETVAKKPRLMPANSGAFQIIVAGIEHEVQSQLQAIAEDPSNLSTGIPRDCAKEPSNSSTGSPPDIGTLHVDHENQSQPEAASTSDSEATAEASRNSSAGRPRAFGDIENEGGDSVFEEVAVGNRLGGKSIPYQENIANNDDPKCAISDFSETETEEEDCENLPLLPSDTDESASADEDRRAYALKHTKSPDLKPGELGPYIPLHSLMFCTEETKLYCFLPETERNKWDGEFHILRCQFLRNDP
jgi:hypothetical protein